MLKLSIILPVYNVALYLKDCLDSCINQDLPKDDYEIICVDDGSTDNSSDIIAQYMTWNPNIVYAKQSNSGVSVARNSGLGIARGKYVWFVDSDDFIECNVMNKLVNIMETHDLDVLGFDYDRVQQDSRMTIPEHKDIEPALSEVKSDYSAMKLVGGASSWAFILKKEYLTTNDIEFNPNISYGEDTLYSFLVLSNSKRAMKMTSNIYHYRLREGSAMHTKSIDNHKKRCESMFCMAEAYKFQYEKCKKQNVNSLLLNNVLTRQHLAVRNVLFSAMMVNFEYANKMKISLKQKGMYPFPIIWWSIKPCPTIKQTLMSWFSLFFGFSSYYYMCSKLISRLKNRKGAYEA